MNQTTRFVLGIYQVNLMVRDTAEYCIVKDKAAYNVDFYKQRKANIEHGLLDNSPLSHFLKQNGENGEKILKQVKEFYEDVYGENNRIVRLIDGNIEVDRACIVQLYDYIVGLHETISDIIKGFVNQAKTVDTQNYDPELEDLVTKDEEFYRGLMGLVLSDEMNRSFIEFNKTIRESQGKQTPQTNFIVNDLKKLVGFFKFVKDHSKIADPLYSETYTKSFTALEYMEGSKKYEGEGQIGNYLDEVRKAWSDYCSSKEKVWAEVYTKIWQELVEFEKDLFSKQQAQTQAKNN